jgi:hypothetical protein
MLENSGSAKRMVRELCISKVEVFIRENSKMEDKMVMEHIPTTEVLK